MEAKVFRTSDTPFAAWLMISGVKLKKVDKTVTPHEFIMENHPDIGELSFKWDTGNPIGNCLAFHKTYRHLIRKVKNGDRKPPTGGQFNDERFSDPDQTTR